MKKLIAAIFFTVFSQFGFRAEATLVGKLDLQTSPLGYIMRDARNGQWRGGYASKIWELDLNGMELFHLGFAHTWDAERGNPAFGLNIGKSVTLGQVGLVVADAFGAGSISAPPFLRYLGDIVGLAGNVSWMPVYTSDVKGPWIYGGGAYLDFVKMATDWQSILKKGL